MAEKPYYDGFIQTSHWNNWRSATTLCTLLFSSAWLFAGLHLIRYCSRLSLRGRHVSSKQLLLYPDLSLFPKLKLSYLERVARISPCLLSITCKQRRQNVSKIEKQTKPKNSLKSKCCMIRRMSHGVNWKKNWLKI